MRENGEEGKVMNEKRAGPGWEAVHERKCCARVM